MTVTIPPVPASRPTTPASPATLAGPRGRSRRQLLLREALGLSLKQRRTAAGQSLRDVSAVAQISPGYLSELERGRKEASSELLASVCQALGTSVADILIDAAMDMQSDGGYPQGLRPLAILTPDSHAAPRQPSPALHGPR